MGDQMAYMQKGKRLVFPVQNVPITRENDHGFIPRKESLLPFEDPAVKFNPNLYNGKGEKKTEVDEEALDLYINRIIVSASVCEVGGEENYGIMDAEDGHRTHPEQVAGPREVPAREKNKKNRKGDKKGRKGKKVEKVVEKTIDDYVVDSNPYDPNGEFDTLVIPRGEFRRLMLSEIKSKARIIHDYYDYQWHHLQEDRIEAYRNIVVWRENYRRVEKQLHGAEMELNCLQKSHDAMQEEFEKMKKAKRQKRNAAKQRRNHAESSVTSAGISVSYTGNSSPGAGKQDEKIELF